MLRLERSGWRLLLLPVAFSLAACNATEPTTASPTETVESDLPGGSGEFGIGPIVRATAEPVDEDAAYLVVEVSLSPAAKSQVHIDFMTADGAAVQGSDYQRAKGRLTFKPGESSKSIRIALVSDEFAEGDESFTLRLHSPDDIRLERAELLLTIIDND